MYSPEVSGAVAVAVFGRRWRKRPRQLRRSPCPWPGPPHALQVPQARQAGPNRCLPSAWCVPKGPVLPRAPIGRSAPAAPVGSIGSSASIGSRWPRRCVGAAGAGRAWTAGGRFPPRRLNKYVCMREGQRDCMMEAGARGRGGFNE